MCVYIAIYELNIYIYINRQINIAQVYQLWNLCIQVSSISNKRLVKRFSELIIFRKNLYLTTEKNNEFAILFLNMQLFHPSWNYFQICYMEEYVYYWWKLFRENSLENIVCVCTYMWMCLLICMSVYVYIYIYICVCVCVCVYIYIYMCVSVYVYIYIYICVCLCMCIYIYMSVYVYVYIYICVCVCVCVYIYICVCVCVCVYRIWHYSSLLVYVLW